MRSLVVFLALLVSACSAGLGTSGSYIVHDARVPSVGIKATSLLDIAAFSGPEIAVGLDGEVLERADRSDEWGQWRLRTLLGIAHEPHPYESPIGYELLLTPGLARTYGNDHASPQFVGGVGVQLGLPMRLASAEPIWRSDDLVGLGLYVVPTVGASWFYSEALELSAGISMRMNLWTAVLP